MAMDIPVAGCKYLFKKKIIKQINILLSVIKSSILPDYCSCHARTCRKTTMMMNTIFDWHRYNQFIFALSVPLR